jgi:putative flippase GtrA
MPHAAATRLMRGVLVRLTHGMDGTTARFLVTGCGAAVLFFVLSFAAVRAGLSPFVGTLSAYAICFVAAYLTQRAWTFGHAHRHRDALPRYLVAQLACGLLSASLARLLGRIGLPPLAMAALVTLASSSLSYALSRFWVFARPSAPRDVERAPEPAGQARNSCL